MAKKISEFTESVGAPAGSKYLIELADGTYRHVDEANVTGGGDMTISVYDPTGINGDAFAMDNMVEGATNLILTAAERAAISASIDGSGAVNRIPVFSDANTVTSFAHLSYISAQQIFQIGDNTAAAILDLNTVNGGGHGGIYYQDSTSTQRFGIRFNSDTVYVSNRAANGTVVLQANTGVAGAGGETSVVTVRDTAVELMVGDLVMNEAADHSEAPAAGKGHLWVRNDVPNVLVYTDDAGTDTVLGTTHPVSVSGTPIDNQVAVWTAADTLEGHTGLQYDSASATTTFHGEVTINQNKVRNDTVTTGNFSIGSQRGTAANVILDYPTGGTLQIRETGGAAFAEFDENNNFGLGTLTPISKLDVRGGATIGFITHTGDGDADVSFFGNGTTAQSGSFESRLRIFGGGSQTRQLQLLQELGGNAKVQTTFGDLDLGATANNANINLLPNGTGRARYYSSTTPLQITNNSGYTIGTFIGTPDANELVIGVGTDFVYASGAVTTWTPKDTAASVIRMDNGTYEYYADSGLTVDVPYTPTRLFYLDANFVHLDSNVSLRLDAGDIVLKEKADHSDTPTATWGQLWVRNDIPTQLIYTDDAGNDTAIHEGGITFPGAATIDASGVSALNLQTNSLNRLSIDSAGVASFFKRMDVYNGASICVFGADDAVDGTRTNATTKHCRLGLAHYTNAEEPVALIRGLAAAAGNTVDIGGGSGLLNAATTIGFYTATNTTTVTGTERLQISSAGNVEIFAGDIVFNEKADHAFTPAAAHGSLWVRNDTPNVLVFTDDAGTDTVLGAGGGGGDVTKVGTPVDNQIGVWTGDGTIEGDANFTWSGTGMDIKGTLDIWNGASVFEIGGDSGSDTLRTNATTKVYRMGFAHYTNAEEPCQIMSGSCTSTASTLNLGGGTSFFNDTATTEIYTAANTTTTTGTRRFNVDTAGNITFDTGYLRLSAAGSSIGLNGKAAGSTYNIYGGQNQNAESSFRCDNTTSGTAAVAGLVVTANAGGGTFKAHSSAFTTSGAAIADGVKLEANSSASGGLTLVAAATGADVAVYAGGATASDLVVTFASDADAKFEGHIERSVTAGITASTTQTQGQGALTLDVNEVSTVANPNDTVTLPTAAAGRKITVINNGASTLQIFPASGDDLGAGLNTATTIATTEFAEFTAYDATNWAGVKLTKI
jgi:hypothetical protein